jgi:hypothetical protein
MKYNVLRTIAPLQVGLDEDKKLLLFLIWNQNRNSAGDWISMWEDTHLSCRTGKWTAGNQILICSVDRHRRKLRNQNLAHMSSRTCISKVDYVSSLHQLGVLECLVFSKEQSPVSEFHFSLFLVCRNSVVCIATRYRPNRSELEYWYRRDFSHPSRLGRGVHSASRAMGSAFPRGTGAGAWSWPLTPI